MPNWPRPNQQEVQFLTLAYNRFCDIFEEVMEDNFWNRDASYRFSKIRDGFGVYSELLHYEPLQWVLDNMRIQRPPLEAEIAKELFRFVRNVITHFPFFDNWESVWVNKSVLTWSGKSQSVDRFLEKYVGKGEVQYRFWEPMKNKMTYLSIRFPDHYHDDAKIYLKDILSEKEGAKFSFILMKKVLDTQVETMNER
jgi:hypothetical protein